MKNKSSKRGDMRINQLNRELHRFLTSKTIKKHSLKRVHSHHKDTMLLTHLHTKTDLKSLMKVDSTIHSKNGLENASIHSKRFLSFLNASCISRNTKRAYVTQCIKSPNEEFIKQSIKNNSKVNKSRKILYRDNSSKDISTDSLKDLAKEFWRLVKFRKQVNNESNMKTPMKAKKILQRSYQQLTDLKASNPTHKLSKITPKALIKEKECSSKSKVSLMLKSMKEEIKKKFTVLIRRNSELKEKGLVQQQLHNTLQQENNELKNRNLTLNKQIQEIKDINKELIKRNTKLVKRNIELSSEVEKNKNDT